MNKYQHAIESDETIDFILGLGKYLYPDKERGGMHMSGATFKEIIEYAKIKGYEKMLIQLESDIKKILKKEDIIPYNFSILCSYIYSYSLGYEEKKLTVEWKLTKDLKDLLRVTLNKLKTIYSNDKKELDYKLKENSHGYFLNNSIRVIDMIERNFKIDILNTGEKEISVNKYQQAIENNEVEDFLLGNGKYRYTNDMDMHNFYLTFDDIVEYSKIFGNQKMLNQLNSDLKKISPSISTPYYYYIVINYIFLYTSSYNNHENNDIVVEWKPDEELRSLLKDKMSELVLTYKIEDKDLGYELKENNHSFYLESVIKLINVFFKRFGVNLLE